MTADQFATYRAAFENLVACARDSAGAACAGEWLADAGPLLDVEPEADYADRDYARAAAEYYVDEILRSAEKRAEYCGSGAG